MSQNLQYLGITVAKIAFEDLLLPRVEIHAERTHCQPQERQTDAELP